MLVLPPPPDPEEPQPVAVAAMPQPAAALATPAAGVPVEALLEEALAPLRRPLPVGLRRARPAQRMVGLVLGLPHPLKEEGMSRLCALLRSDPTSSSASSSLLRKASTSARKSFSEVSALWARSSQSESVRRSPSGFGGGDAASAAACCKGFSSASTWRSASAVAVRSVWSAKASCLTSSARVLHSECNDLPSCWAWVAPAASCLTSSERVLHSNCSDLPSCWT
mmetsp:Transcript_129261/g.288239  ORF Transcript_129261/g.288239 Transcript_129261/m.288239 type:complete len:224 (+) Transcript_129261:92-763(+)